MKKYNLWCFVGLHKWENWHYKDDESCRQERVCVRNNEHRQTREQHDWGSWDYVIDRSCEQERVCTHNNEHRQTREQHEGEKLIVETEEIEDTGAWADSSQFQGTPVNHYETERYYCTRCPKLIRTGNSKWVGQSAR